MAGARRRGVGFGGIPLGEQATYTATQYLPALARLRQSGREQAMGLEDSIQQIMERRSTMAQQVRQSELDRDEQQRQFNQQLAASRGGSGGGLSSALAAMLGGGGGGSRPVASATASQRADKGFDFTDAQGNPISAAAYAAAKGIPFTQVLKTMADAGDSGAAAALGFVGDDFGYDPRKVNSKPLADLYNALVWGTGRSAQPMLPPGYGTGAYLKAPSNSGTNVLTRGLPANTTRGF